MNKLLCQTTTTTVNVCNAHAAAALYFENPHSTNLPHKSIELESTITKLCSACPREKKKKDTCCILFNKKKARVHEPYASSECVYIFSSIRHTRAHQAQDLRLQDLDTNIRRKTRRKTLAIPQRQRLRVRDRHHRQTCALCWQRMHCCRRRKPRRHPCIPKSLDSGRRIRNIQTRNCQSRSISRMC